MIQISGADARSMLSIKFFNFLTDGSMRYDGGQAIKNMDDVLLYGRTIEEL